jgi:hypothetical protein
MATTYNPAGAVWRGYDALYLGRLQVMGGAGLTCTIPCSGRWPVDRGVHAKEWVDSDMHHPPL